MFIILLLGSIFWIFIVGWTEDNFTTKVNTVKQALWRIIRWSLVVILVASTTFTGVYRSTLKETDVKEILKIEYDISDINKIIAKIDDNILLTSNVEFWHVKEIEKDWPFWMSYFSETRYEIEPTNLKIGEKKW